MECESLLWFFRMLSVRFISLYVDDCGCEQNASANGMYNINNQPPCGRYKDVPNINNQFNVFINFE